MLIQRQQKNPKQQVKCSKHVINANAMAKTAGRSVKKTNNKTKDNNNK